MFYKLLPLIMIVSLSSCKKITAGDDEESSTTAAVLLGAYTCPSYSSNVMYDSMLACQLTTGANCTSSAEVFPNGSSATCYTPLSGWESCLSSPPSWEYTVYTLQSITPTGYRLKRSLLGCSSETCLCTGSAIDLQMDVVFGAFVENVSGLPSPCTTASCGPYVYQGAMTVAGLTYFLNTAPAAVGSPPVSTDAAPTITVMGPSGFTMSVYDNASCTGSAIGTAVIAAGTGTTGPMAMATAGMKNFWATFSDGFTTTSCADTGVSYFRVTSPSLAQPAKVVVPSSTYPSGSVISMNFGNATNVGMSYTCMYDNIVDGALVGGANCTSLTGVVFNTTNGILTYSPSSALNNTFEFQVIGTNMAGSDTKYNAVYLINGAVYGIAPMADNSYSANANPTISVNAGAGAPNFEYGLFSDSTCSTLLALTILDGSGMASIPIALTNVPGVKKFYGMYQHPTTSENTICLDTTMNYHLITAPALAQPTPAIFPSNQVKTGTPITLNFQASDNTNVTYTCFYDRLVDNSAVATPCSSLPVSSFGTSTGIFTWTPSVSTYGAFEFCVSATNIAGSDSKCTVVDVIPNSLILTNLSHYYDAQFSYNPLTVDGGANINPSNTWKDLIGSVDATLNNTQGTTASGWFNTSFWNTAVTPNATTTAYSARLNSGAGTVPLSNPTNPSNSNYPFVYGLHQDYADINPLANKTTNANQSITLDMWINPIDTPVTTQSVMLQPDWCCGGVPQYCSIPDFGNGCSAFAMNNVPVYSVSGFIFNYYDNTDGDNPGFSAYIRDEDMADNSIKDSSSSGYRVVLDLKKYDGTWTTWIISGVYSYGSWKHITAIWDQPTRTKSLYINGVHIGSVSEAPSNHFPITSRRLIMGCDTSANNRFNGEVSKIRMYDISNVGIPSANYNAEKKQFGIP